jgi:hypothetical protein
MEMMQLKGCRLAEKQHIHTEFKISYGWVTHFMSRHDLPVRHQLMTAQKLPKAYEKKLVSFPKYVLKLKYQHECLLGN